jgi:hypothetical protein
MSRETASLMAPASKRSDGQRFWLAAINPS